MLIGQFLGSVSTVGAMAMERARNDLQEAMREGYFRVQDMELAEAIAFGIMVFSLRATHAREASDIRALEVVRAIFSALGVDPLLIEQALSIPLPPQESMENPI